MPLKVSRLWRVIHSFMKAIKMAHTGLSIFAKDGYIANGPGPLKGWTESRDFPKPAKQSFRDWWKRNEDS